MPGSWHPCSFRLRRRPLVPSFAPPGTSSTVCSTAAIPDSAGVPMPCSHPLCMLPPFPERLFLVSSFHCLHMPTSLFHNLLTSLGNLLRTPKMGIDTPALCFHSTHHLPAFTYVLLCLVNPTMKPLGERPETCSSYTPRVLHCHTDYSTSPNSQGC